ncbi:MAG: beta-galactosidase, partial [Chloroflexota bacterium]
TPYFLFCDRHRNPVTGGAPTYDATRYPYACCELGAGIQITYHHRPVVPAACVEAMAVVALGSGANLLGYYMFHGGSQHMNRRGYTNEYSVPRISYDFQAPVREFGQLNQSYHALKLIHLFLHAFGEQLAPLPVELPEGSAESPHDIDTPRIAARTANGRGFLFLTNYQDHVEMREHDCVTIRIDTGNEQIVLPRQNGLKLLREVSAILPLNLMLGVFRLVYGTAQPLTILNTARSRTWVFFAVPGMPAEYAFSRNMLREVEAPGARMEADEDRVYVTVSPGTTALLTLTALDGSVVSLLTLTRAQALHCGLVSLDGQARLVLSDATVIEDDAGLRLTSRDEEKGFIDLAIYPAPAYGLETAEGCLEESEDGIFTRYSIPLPRTRVEVQITPLPDRQFLIRIPGGIPPGAEDVFLRIRYDGDIGEAYIGGMLVNDNFCNGEPWEIGLKRFAEHLAEHDLLLKIVPRQARGDSAKYEATGMAARLTDAAGGIGTIHTAEAVVEYRITAWPRRAV